MKKKKKTTRGERVLCKIETNKNSILLLRTYLYIYIYILYSIFFSDIVFEKEKVDSKENRSSRVGKKIILYYSYIQMISFLVI